MNLGLLLGVLGVVLPFLLPTARIQEWIWGLFSALYARNRQKKLERLQARKAFLIELRASETKQMIYLGQSALILIACVAGMTMLGVNTYLSFPKLFPGYVGVCATVAYLLVLYKLGVHRRAYVAIAFQKTIEQLDTQIAALQTATDQAAA
jgi:hypothetical protein